LQVATLPNPRLKWIRGTRRRCFGITVGVPQKKLPTCCAEPGEYCARHGLKPTIFARWMKHLIGVEEARKHADELRELRRKNGGGAASRAGPVVLIPSAVMRLRNRASTVPVFFRTPASATGAERKAQASWIPPLTAPSSPQHPADTGAETEGLACGLLPPTGSSSPREAATAALIVDALQQDSGLVVTTTRRCAFSGT
jgi:hypothetical protein